MENKEIKDAVLNIRLTCQEKENLRKYAEEAGISMSEVIVRELDEILHPFGKY